MTPWTERSGRFSPLKAACFALTLAPALYIAGMLAAGAYPARPWSSANHDSGDWALRFLLLTLLVTPLRRITGWNRLITVRRMLGLATFAYGALHFAFYVADLGGDLPRVAGEIASRFYLAVGFAALAGLAALAATSTDAAVRRLGRSWTRLHRLVYAIAPLAAWHFFMQTRLDVYQPTWMAGLFVLAFMLRPVAGFTARHGFALGPAAVSATAAAAAAITMGLEAAWYGIVNHLPAERILMANFSLAAGLRPSWWVLFAGIAAALVSRPARQFARTSFLKVRNGLTSSGYF